MSKKIKHKRTYQEEKEFKKVKLITFPILAMLSIISIHQFTNLISKDR